MRVLSHPFRFDPAGAVVTVDQAAPRAAAELAAAVLSTQAGERGLAPEWGMPDPVGRSLSTQMIGSVIEYCEPDLVVVDVEVEGYDTVQCRVNVQWTGEV